MRKRMEVLPNLATSRRRSATASVRRPWPVRGGVLMTAVVLGVRLATMLFRGKGSLP